MPGWLFATLAAVGGFAFAALTPPLQAPDEQRHLLRAFMIARGRLAAVRGADGSVGHAVPCSVADMLARVDRGVPRAGGALPAPAPFATYLDFLRRHGGDRLRFRTDRVVDVPALRSELGVPMDGGCEEFVPLPSPYPPLAYAPQALAAGLVWLLGAPPVTAVHLGRLFNLAAWIALGVAALQRIPAHGWTLACVALTPMSLFLAASLSPDAATNGLAFLFTACTLRAAARRTPMDGRELAALLALAAGLGLVKPTYVPLALLLLLVPAERCGGRARHLGLVAAALLAGVVPSAAWSAWLQSLGVGPRLPGTDPAAQVAYVVAHPLAFVAALARTLGPGGFGWAWVSSFVGILGWMDTVLPTPVYVLYPLGLLAVALADGGSASPVRGSGRWVTLVAGASCAVAVLAAAYVGWTPVGARAVSGVQGRYFLPCAPALLVALHWPRARGLPQAARVAVGSGVALTLAVAAWCLTQRFWVG